VRARWFASPQLQGIEGERDTHRGFWSPLMSRAARLAGFLIHQQSPLVVFSAQMVGIFVLLGSKS
jgi:hypothetical protein